VQFYFYFWRLKYIPLTIDISQSKQSVTGFTQRLKISIGRLFLSS